jgi:hypothetical protein
MRPGADVVRQPDAAARIADRPGDDPPPATDGAARGTDNSPPDRHLVVGVSHPSNDPTRHRVMEIRAVHREALGGWVAQVGEQNANEQFQGWGPNLGDGGGTPVFPTAAACLGDAVAFIVALVDREAASPTVPSAPPGSPPPGQSSVPETTEPTRSPARWWPRRRRTRTRGSPRS